MAIPKIKATYSLDVETIRALERAAARWQVSKSEALRRAILAADSGGLVPHSETLDALDELQRAAGLTTKRARQWKAAVRRERRARDTKWP